MSAFALAAWIFTQQGSAASVGLLQMCAFAPIVLLAPIAGTCADRYDRRALMIAGDGGSILGLLLVLWALNGGGSAVDLSGNEAVGQAGGSEVAILLVLLGITIASSLAAFTEPALRATVSDLLKPEEYVRASGMLQLAASSKLLISPVLAALVMTASSVQVVLLIDAATAVVTVACTLYVRRGMTRSTPVVKLGAARQESGGREGRRRQESPVRKECTALQERPVRLERLGWEGTNERPSFLHDLLSSRRSITASPQVTTMVAMMALLTLTLGAIQTLLKPMLLPHYSLNQVGLVESLAACGLIAGGALVAVLTDPRPDWLLRVGIGAVSLAALLVGLRPSMWWVAGSCALVFAALAACNAGAEAGVRDLIPNEQQGHAWGTIGLITQMGFLIAYALAGPLADYVFTPALMEGGALVPTLGWIFGTGPGRGIGLLISCVGIALAPLTLAVPRMTAAYSRTPSAKEEDSC